MAVKDTDFIAFEFDRSYLAGVESSVGHRAAVLVDLRGLEVVGTGEEVVKRRRIVRIQNPLVCDVLLAPGFDIGVIEAAVLEDGVPD